MDIFLYLSRHKKRRSDHLQKSVAGLSIDKAGEDK